MDLLVRACDASAGFLEDEPAAAYAAPLVAASISAADPTPSAELSALGVRVGPYRVVREAAHGGMGIVYLAERDDDEYRRRVALKLLRWGAQILASHSSAAGRPLGLPHLPAISRGDQLQF